MYRASRHAQETLGATGSNRKSTEVAAEYPPTTNLLELRQEGLRVGEVVAGAPGDPLLARGGGLVRDEQRGVLGMGVGEKIRIR